jgi:ABC-type sugar transport system substrate-binding protein
MSVMGLLALTSVTQQALAAEKKTICFVTFSLQIAYFQSSVAGGKRAAAEMGAELVVFDPQADAGRQVTLFEDCIARNVDGIVVDPIESSALAGVIEEAGGRNIPIAVLDTPIDSPHVIANIGVPQYDASDQFGQYISAGLPGSSTARRISGSCWPRRKFSFCAATALSRPCRPCPAARSSPPATAAIFWSAPRPRRKTC